MYQTTDMLGNKIKLVLNTKIHYIFHQLFGTSLIKSFRTVPVKFVMFISPLLTTCKANSMVELQTEWCQGKYRTVEWKECSSNLKCEEQRL
jgi:hypothetical protein